MAPPAKSVDMLWGEVMEFDTRSWTECFSSEELQGGPSPTGNSWWQLFEICPHLFEIYHIRRLRPLVRSEPLEVGGLYHEARAAYYTKGLQGVSPEECIAAAFAVIDRCQDHVPHITAVVRRLLQGWLHAHGPGKITDDREETLLVEPLIEVSNGFPYSTRIDRVILSEKAGGPVIMEIKTASRQTSTLLKSYAVDPQFLGQIYCWENSNYREEYGSLKRFIVDLTVKGRGLVFLHEVVPISHAAVLDWERAKREVWLQMVRCRRYKYWPRNRANCVRWGRLCEAHAHCENAGIARQEAFPGWVKKAVGEY